LFFFFNDTAANGIYTLSLPGAPPVPARLGGGFGAARYGASAEQAEPMARAHSYSNPSENIRIGR